MNKQPWMLFRTEDAKAHYFWEGTFPGLVQVVPEEKREDWYWDGPDPKPLNQTLINDLNTIALGKSRILKVNKKRFVIIAKGVFDNE